MSGKRIILGDHFHCRVQCTDANDSPVAPDACPTIDVYAADDTKVIDAKKIPLQDKAVATGLFYYPLLLNGAFAAGSYRVRYKWTVSGFNGVAIETFEVVGGGHGDGQYISAFYLHRPFADFLIGQTDGGVIDRVKNPRF